MLGGGTVLAVLAWTLPASADVSSVAEKASENLLDKGILGSLLILALLALVALFFLMRRDRDRYDAALEKKDAQLLEVVTKITVKLTESEITEQRVLRYLEKRSEP